MEGRSVLLGAILIGALACATDAGAFPGYFSAWEFATATNASSLGPFDFGANFRLRGGGGSGFVTALGYYDDGGDGFLGSHDVALYNSSGVLLASATITSADPLIGHFRYAAIRPITISNGLYQIDGVSGRDAYTWNTQIFSTPPWIAYLGDSWTFGSTPDFQPLAMNDVADGYWGANLIIIPALGPEPGTWALMLLGFGLAGRALRRKDASSAGLG